MTGNHCVEFHNFGTSFQGKLPLGAEKSIHDTADAEVVSIVLNTL